MQEQVIFMGFSQSVYISQSAVSVMDVTNCHVTLYCILFNLVYSLYV